MERSCLKARARRTVDCVWEEDLAGCGEKAAAEGRVSFRVALIRNGGGGGN